MSSPADLLRRLGCTPAEALALALLAAGATAALGLLWLQRPADVGPADIVGGSEPAVTATGLHVDRTEVVVYVAGLVARPGLHTLPGGARVADALEAAGGALAGANLDGLNLARPLVDGEQLVVSAPPPAAPAAPKAVPRDSAPAPRPAPTTPTPGEHGRAAADPEAEQPGPAISVNTATAAQLEELPGIGPVLAERIVSHREEIGGFGAVADLQDVPGIGEKTFAAIAPLVSL